MKRIFTDQMGRKVEIDHPPKRIVSLVPSQTELLFYVGLDEEVVGITKFCVHPRNKWKTRARVGGTKRFHFDRIAALHPDLIIGNKEENERSAIETLEQQYPVWMSDVVALEDALDMIRKIGELTGKAESAGELVHAIERTVRPRVAYLIWREPWMAVAKDTFIHTMIEKAGFRNVFEHKTRYPEITLDELRREAPDIVMLSSEPYPFREKHMDEIRQHCRESVVTLVDGEMFSWYGNRLLKSAGYLKQLRKKLTC